MMASLFSLRIEMILKVLLLLNSDDSVFPPFQTGDYNALTILNKQYLEIMIFKHLFSSWFWNQTLFFLCLFIEGNFSLKVC